MRFTDLNLPVALAQGLTDAGYTEPTAVQAACLPAVLTGGDVIAQAFTGSGKTAVLAIGVLAGLAVHSEVIHGLVLCPTRELAEQVSREIRRLARGMPNVRVLTLCGGVPVRSQLASLTRLPHIVVGTPGRITDLVQRQALPLQTVAILVLDEVDRMLDMGFAPAINALVQPLPADRQTLLFSATIPPAIRDLSRTLQRGPLEIKIDSEVDRPRIEQLFFRVDEGAKLLALRSLLLHYQPESAVVFCNTRDAVRNVAAGLAKQGFNVLSLHGDLDQVDRESTLVRFANRSCTVLVASDVAARGLDIEGLSMVVNHDLANDADTHLHRIGRTGRAGHTGLAASLCAGSETTRLRNIAAGSDTPLQWGHLEPETRHPPPAPFVTLMIDAGRQDKMRAGDLLGALTGSVGLPADAVGKIDVFATRTYVAIRRGAAAQARSGLRAGKIKGRSFRVRELVE